MQRPDGQKSRKCARTKILAELGRLSHGLSAGRENAQATPESAA
jgi:hypothetical protein